MTVNNIFNGPVIINHYSQSAPSGKVIDIDPSDITDTEITSEEPRPSTSPETQPADAPKGTDIVVKEPSQSQKDAEFKQDSETEEPVKKNKKEKKKEKKEARKEAEQPKDAEPPANDKKSGKRKLIYGSAAAVAAIFALSSIFSGDPSPEEPGPQTKAPTGKTAPQPKFTSVYNLKENQSPRLSVDAGNSIREETLKNFVNPPDWYKEGARFCSTTTPVGNIGHIAADAEGSPVLLIKDSARKFKLADWRGFFTAAVTARPGSYIAPCEPGNATSGFNNISGNSYRTGVSLAALTQENNKYHRNIATGIMANLQRSEEALMVYRTKDRDVNLSYIPGKREIDPKNQDFSPEV
jgi:hypothetical protein